jgi:superfamily I DNA/RNA helicase
MSNPGRPAKAVQRQMEKILRPYFERNVTASYAARETGINIKTVCNYFNQWSEQIRTETQKDFLSRQQELRERTILNYDDLIFKEYQILDNVDKAIKRYKNEVPKHLVNVFQDLIKTIANLIEKKGQFTIQPVPEEVIRQKISEMKKHDPK